VNRPFRLRQTDLGLGGMTEVTGAEGLARPRAAMLLIVTSDGLLMHHRDDKPGIAHPGSGVPSSPAKPSRKLCIGKWQKRPGL
jgi:hypothetical protein